MHFTNICNGEFTVTSYDQAKQVLREALEKVLEEKIETLEDDQRMFEDFHLDSTTMLETLLVIDHQLQLNVDPEELDIDNFLTVKDYCKSIVQIAAESQVDPS